MKKLGLGIIAVIAAGIIFINIPSLLFLIVTVGVAYWSFKKYMESTGGFSKVAWFAIGLGFAFLAITNVPALIGLVGVWMIWLVVKKWNKQENATIEGDPFKHFEDEWSKLQTK
ncbi:hypothetical protein [Mangrovibacillus cuniculi]|uniref:Flagellar basal body rod protein n=1 Tax=Mangrovibacillus cuniculi TaxID=2593652 RepID=A0A7S8C995_9BACI|nr:hypothetical protein [Mangrovibacillus cuniculi]QPC45734.1 hypothetical protein G8O30_01480 [Mangrovibacillus cuniculi]